MGFDGLETSIRYGNEGSHRNVFNRQNAKHYGSPHPFEDRHVDWRWLTLWKQENPHPYDHPDGIHPDNADEYSTEYRKMHGRVWAQFHFPQLRIMDWTNDEEVEALRRMVSRHICGVCGRADDPGCTEGC